MNLLAIFVMLREFGWKQALSLHKHFDGVQHSGVDRVATLHMCEKGALSSHCLRLLRSILVDAVWALSRLFQAGRVDTSACACGHDRPDAFHFFWDCPLLVDLKAKHSLLMSVRQSFGPWLPRLELCGVVPAELAVPQHSRSQIAVWCNRTCLMFFAGPGKKMAGHPNKMKHLNRASPRLLLSS